MVSHLFFYQLKFLGLLWLCVMLPAAWPNECPGGEQRPSKPLPPPPAKAPAPRSQFLAPTTRPHVPPARCPPPRIVPTRGRPRPVDTSRHCCPHPDCASRGWVGWGNLRANGLPP